ncbi:MAG: RNA 2',3'-cyclic phosphodiesterase, partial [Nitrososphaeria archaeon]|nr:RNA 2',3'-cyclic phosphodiesterase [Nitrososphaeria archaeon]
MGLIRSFIAIELPEEIRLELARLEDSLKSGGISFVKWVNPLGIHLTLKFLGNVAPAMVAKITTAMAEVAGGRTPFRLEVGRLGIFPNIRQPRLAWVGVEGEVDKLAKLQRQIDASLSLLGFPKEQRPFTPHLTLGRLRDRASTRQRQQFGEL